MAKVAFFIIFILSMVLKVPIAFCMGLASFAWFLLSGFSLLTMPQMMMSTFDSFTLLAIPLFMLAGYIMNSTGITNRMFKFANNCVGHIPGGLGQVNVLCSLIFAGMSGSATADAGGLGVIEIEAMKEEGYDAEFSAAVTAASSVVGTIMPPSLGFVVYGALTGASVGRLFLAGMIPAFIITINEMATVYRIAKKRNYPILPKPSKAELWESFKGAFFPLLSPVILLVLISTGVVTPTEAAVVTLVYALILGAGYGELSWKNLVSDFLNVGKSASKIMLIVSFASVFGWILTFEQIPAKLADSMLSVTTNPILIILMINVLLLFLGCFMEGLSVQLIMIPILLPVLAAANINLVHFGVIMELNLNIGLITPPVGVFIYLVADIAKTTFEKVTKELLRFILVLIGTLLLLAFVPQFTTFLPNLLMP